MKRNLLKDNAAQLSMELILILAAVLAVALLVISSVKGTAESGEKISGKTASKVLKELK